MVVGHDDSVAGIAAATALSCPAKSVLDDDGFDGSHLSADGLGRATGAKRVDARQWAESLAG